MGEVYRGQHQRTRRPVAIKLLHPHMVDDPVLLARFRREAEIAGAVDSDHVVEVIDADVDDGQPFIVLELLLGRSLQETVEHSSGMDPAQVAQIASQVAAGLNAAHDASVVHRDLKPENLILVETPGGLRTKILDFGISKIRGNATAITNEIAIIGTPDFMSPEQAVGNTDAVDQRADIFSLGAVLYFALTGRRPFRASSVPAILMKICEEEPPPLSDFRPDLGPRAAQLAAVIAIAMAKRPEERYATTTQLAHDFAVAAQGALPEEVMRRTTTLRRGRPATTGVGDRTVSATNETLPATT
jgi:serine/threonine-protein kinase